MCTAWCQHFAEVKTDAHEQWISRNAAITINPGGVIDWAFGDMNCVAGIGDVGPGGQRRQRGAGPCGAVWVVGAKARPNDVVDTEQREPSTLAEINRLV